MAPLLALLPLALLPLAAATPMCDHGTKNKHLAARKLSGGALVTRPVDWSRYRNETFTYRGRSWTVPNQNTSEPYFDWNTVDGCNDDAYVYSCPEAANMVLSYDDGPSNFTAELLDILKARNVKATLCMVGKNINLLPDVVLRAAQEGHDLCIHSENHKHLPNLSTREIIDEVLDPIEKFKAILGVTPRFFRPPYGEMDLRVKAIMEQVGLTVLRWNFDSFDSHNATIAESVERFIGAMKTPNQWTYGSPAGDSYISLSHDVIESTVKQLTPAVIPVIPQNGFKILNPSECLGLSRFIEGDGAFTKTASPAAPTAATSAGPRPTATVTTTKEEESGAGGLVAGGVSALAAAAVVAALL